MSPLYSLKIIAYGLFNTRFGKLILKSLSAFVSVKNLKKSNAEGKHPFIVSITIDTESGYVRKNEHRVWQKSEPEAYIGFYKGMENWRSLLNKHNSKATFFLSTNCFSAKGEDHEKILKQLKLLLKEGHEIGLHMHPDSDLALQISLKERFWHTSAGFYDYNKINQFIKASKNLIQKNLGINAVSFRWGNWALNSDAAKALQQSGFKFDSSATPGIKGHINDGMHYDWSKANEHYPWRLSLKDYQNTKNQDSKIVEIPIATFNFLGIALRADPANSALLQAAFDYYYKNADRSRKPFVFVIISHSIEGTYDNGLKTKVIDIMDEFIAHAKKTKNVRFMSIKEAENL